MDRREIIDEIRAIVNADELNDLRQSTTAAMNNQLSGLSEGFRNEISRIQNSNKPIGLRLLDEFSSDLTRQFDSLNPHERGLFAKKIVMSRLIKLPDRLENSTISADIISEYAVAARYISSSLIKETDEYYGNRMESYFDRDIRVCEFLTIPAGAQIVDMRAWIPKSFYKNHGIKENLRCLAFVISRLGGRGPLFRIHTDTRNLTKFNENGWNECYLRIAQIFEQMPEVKGVVGTSWFYDPQLLTISPKLKYLQVVPISAGAFLRIDGPGEIHTERAITRSPTRRKLYEEGTYQPVCATLVWTRSSLIKWSKKYKAKK